MKTIQSWGLFRQVRHPCCRIGSCTPFIDVWCSSWAAANLTRILVCTQSIIHTEVCIHSEVCMTPRVGLRWLRKQKFCMPWNRGAGSTKQYCDHWKYHYPEYLFLSAVYFLAVSRAMFSSVQEQWNWKKIMPPTYTCLSLTITKIILSIICSSFHSFFSILQRWVIWLFPVRPWFWHTLVLTFFVLHFPVLGTTNVHFLVVIFPVPPH